MLRLRLNKQVDRKVCLPAGPMYVIQNCLKIQICMKRFTSVYIKNRQLHAGMILAIIKEKAWQEEDTAGQEIIFGKDREGI